MNAAVKFIFKEFAFFSSSTINFFSYNDSILLYLDKHSRQIDSKIAKILFLVTLLTLEISRKCSIILK